MYIFSINKFIDFCMRVGISVYIYISEIIFTNLIIAFSDITCIYFSQEKKTKNDFIIKKTNIVHCEKGTI